MTPEFERNPAAAIRVQARPLTASLVAGASTGLIGVLLFGAIHAAIIVPIWSRLLGGVPFGIGAGLAMGWALHELHASRRLGTGAAGALTFGFLVWATTLPMTVIATAFRAPGLHGTDNTWEAILESVLAFSAGAIAGRVIGKQRRTAIAMGTTSLGVALAQRGPIPIFSGGRAIGLFDALAAMYLVCALGLERGASMVSRRRRTTARQ